MNFDRTAPKVANLSRSPASENGVSRRDALTLAAAGLAAPLLPAVSFAETRKKTNPVSHIGLGDQFDGVTGQAYRLGSVTVLPGNPSHLHWAGSGEYVAQVTAIGPLILQYLDPGDDPRSGGAPWSRRLGMTETKWSKS